MHAGLPCRRGGETKAGRDIGYYHMEKLTSLDRLPYNGFLFSSKDREWSRWLATGGRYT